MITANGASGTTHDFFCYDDTGQVWNGSAFVAWDDDDYATYRVTATERGTSGAFTGTEASGTSRYEMRVRGASLALSYVVWAEEIQVDIDGYTFTEAQRLMLAAMVGPITGGGTGTNVIKGADESKARITGTYDNLGNRTVTDLDAT